MLLLPLQNTTVKKRKSLLNVASSSIRNQEACKDLEQYRNVRTMLVYSLQTARGTFNVTIKEGIRKTIYPVEGPFKTKKHSYVTILLADVMAGSILMPSLLVLETKVGLVIF
jgi:hypothetical protein